MLDGTTPMFRYYAYNTAAPPTASLALARPGRRGRPRRAIARVVDHLRRARAGRGDSASATRAAITFTDDVYFRSADPNDPAPYPTCA